MKSVMYHYIQDFNPRMKYLSYLNYKNFEKQIKVFKNSFDFIDCSEAKNFDADVNLNKKIFLTFDDGLLSHYNYVLPILKKNNINAIFYIPTAPYINQKILGVHKIHLILGSFGGKVACNFLDKYIDVTMLDNNLVEEFEKLTYKLQENSDYINKFKRVLNYYIKYEYRDNVIDDIFINFFGNKEKDMIKNVYMSLNQINELYKSGMVIGSHSVSHRLMSRLNEEEFKNEIDNSFDLLRNFEVYKTFCYPYGGFHSFKKEIEQYLNNKSVLFSVNVESRDINNSDLKNRRQALPRFDCNEFEYGKIDINH